MQCAQFLYERATLFTTRPFYPPSLLCLVESVLLIEERAKNSALSAVGPLFYFIFIEKLENGAAFFTVSKTFVFLATLVVAYQGQALFSSDFQLPYRRGRWKFWGCRSIIIIVVGWPCELLRFRPLPFYSGWWFVLLTVVGWVNCA